MRLWGDGVVNLQSLFPFLGQWTRYTRFAQLLHWNLGLFTEFMADYSNLITLPACISQWLGVLAGSVTSHRVRAETKLFIFQNKGHLSTGRVPVGTRPSAWFCHSATVFIHRYCQSMFLKNVHNVALKMLEACFKVAYFLNCAHLAWKGVNTWQELLLEHAEPLWINSTSLQPVQETGQNYKGSHILYECSHKHFPSELKFNIKLLFCFIFCFVVIFIFNRNMYDAATATLESFYSLKVVSKSSSSLFFVTRVVKTL